MKLHNTSADILVPDATDKDAALARTTHLGIGAHQDDLEIMAYHGIAQCFGKTDRWFTGVTCTNGSGSPRSGVYADCTDADMCDIRREEQRTAARIGRYAAILQLDYASKEVKDPANRRLDEDLVEILRPTRPDVVYTHSPFDKHATHVGVFLAVLNALRALPAGKRPGTVYACEVWRDLDWVPDDRRIALDCAEREHLAAALVGVYDSQIAGGKRYDLASLGRRRANATYLDSHAVDESESASFALDITSLINAPQLDLDGYVDGVIDGLRDAVVDGIRALV